MGQDFYDSADACRLAEAYAADGAACKCHTGTDALILFALIFYFFDV